MSLRPAQSKITYRLQTSGVLVACVALAAAAGVSAALAAPVFVVVAVALLPAVLALGVSGRTGGLAAAGAVTDAVHDAILTLDESGHVLAANPAAERLYGWSAAELAGRSWLVLRSDEETVDERRLFHQATELMLASGTTAATTFRHRDGSAIDVEFSLAALERGTVVVARDVSGRRQVEETVREQSLRIAALASAQSQIAGGGASPHETMELIGAAACRLVASGGAAIMLPDGEHLVCRAAVGTTAQWAGARVQIAGSLAGGAYRTGQLASAVAGELESEPLLARSEQEVGALLAAPLREGSTPAGVLVVAHARGQTFDERDLRLLELFSGMAASVLHRAQVEHSLAVTHAVAQAVSVDATLESGLSGALPVLTGRLGWDAAAVWLESDEHEGALVCQADLIDAGLPAQQLQSLFAAPLTAGSHPAAWSAFDSGDAFWVELSRGEQENTSAAALAGCGLASAVYVPLRSHGRAIGVLELLQRRPHGLDAGELALLQTLAAQIANFIARRQAEARMGTQAENLASVVALSQMLASVPVSHVRQALCEAIAEMARADVVAIYEPDGDGGYVVTGQAGDAPLPDGPVDSAAVTLIGTVFAERASRFLPTPETAVWAADELIVRTGMRSGYLEPVLRDGEAVAVLAVASRSPRVRRVDGFGELAKLLAAEASTTLALADLVRALDARARTDELTGLANRRTWDEELPKELARAKRTARPVSVAILDLDHFKAYNDTYGHPAGDRLLRAVAAGWVSRLRETDLLARYGGEEFGVVLPDCDLEAAGQVLDELRLCMPDGNTCSIGVARWDGEESPEDLVARADAALYDAKRSGRDRIAAAR